MSEALIKKLNAISHGNLSDPMVVRMDDWNEAMDEVRSVLDDLTAAKAEIEQLRGSLSEAVDRINDMLLQDDGQAYKEAEKFVDRLRQQAKAAEKGGDDEPA